MAIMITLTMSIKTKADAESISAQIKNRIDDLLPNAKILSANLEIIEHSSEDLRIE